MADATSPGPVETTDDGTTSVQVILEFTEHVTLSNVGLRESHPLGLRVDAFVLGQWQEGVWGELAPAQDR